MGYMSYYKLCVMNFVSEFSCDYIYYPAVTVTIYPGMFPHLYISSSVIMFDSEGVFVVDVIGRKPLWTDRMCRCHVYNTHARRFGHAFWIIARRADGMTEGGSSIDSRGKGIGNGRT